MIAHRGGLGLMPENTLPAFNNAESLGADIIELDIHTSKDGHIVIMHDDDIDRTTDGSGKVSDFTLAELKQFDAGYNWTDDDGNDLSCPDRSDSWNAFEQFHAVMASCFSHHLLFCIRTQRLNRVVLAQQQVRERPAAL